MVCIIMLNWNGSDDTIECLKSLQEMSYDDYMVIVGDNGSHDNSVSLISDYCKSASTGFYSQIIGEETPINPGKRSVILYELKENNGFSRGNNLIVQYASRFSPDYYLLLNNDTVVEPDFLDKLVSYQKSKPELKILTPLIHYFYDKTLIWNAGGNINWGFRKYHYINKSVSTIKEKEFIPCTYITGCAMFFVPELLDSENRIFTEQYYFGEEDFELAQRMNRDGVKMGCLLDSHIYHKVSQSTKGTVSLGKSYIFYLGRFIDVRHFMPRWQFFFWVSIYLVYILLYQLRHGTSFKNVFKLIRKLLRESKRLDGITKEYFFNHLRNGL